MSEKFKGMMSDAAGYLAIALVSLIYVGTAVFVPGVTGKSISTILAEGATGFVLGLAINFNLNLQGILKGKRSEQMQATRRTHGEAVERIAPSIVRLDGWCMEQNAAALRRERARILMGAGMRYEDYFDRDGVPLRVSLAGLPDETAKMRRRALRAAIKVKITPLSTAALTGDGERLHDPFDFGETPEQYQRRTNMTDVFSKIVMAVIFGYFGVDMVENFQFAELAWRALYVALLLALGVSKLLRSYLFVVDTYRGGIVQKINHLQSFENWVRAHQKEKEKNGNNVQLGSIQDGSGKAAGSEKAAGKGVGLCELPKATQISASKDGGAELGNDRERQDRGQQQLPAESGGGG